MPQHFFQSVSSGKTPRKRRISLADRLQGEIDDILVQISNHESQIVTANKNRPISAPPLSFQQPYKWFGGSDLGSAGSAPVGGGIGGNRSGGLGRGSFSAAYGNTSGLGNAPVLGNTPGMNRGGSVSQGGGYRSPLWDGVRGFQRGGGTGWSFSSSPIPSERNRNTPPAGGEPRQQSAGGLPEPFDPASQEYNMPRPRYDEFRGQTQQVGRFGETKPSYLDPIEMEQQRTGGIGGMKEGGSVSTDQAMAKEVASMGQGTDTTLLHLNPDELEGLASLLNITINPDTGYPQAYVLPPSPSPDPISTLWNLVALASAIFQGSGGGQPPAPPPATTQTPTTPKRTVKFRSLRGEPLEGTPATPKVSELISEPVSTEPRKVDGDGDPEVSEEPRDGDGDPEVSEEPRIYDNYQQKKFAEPKPWYSKAYDTLSGPFRKSTPPGSPPGDYDLGKLLFGAGVASTLLPTDYEELDPLYDDDGPVGPGEEGPGIRRQVNFDDLTDEELDAFYSGQELDYFPDGQAGGQVVAGKGIGPEYNRSDQLRGIESMMRNYNLSRNPQRQYMGGSLARPPLAGRVRNRNRGIDMLDTIRDRRR